MVVEPVERITPDQLHMATAWSIQGRSTCPIDKVGAILVKESQIVSYGYTGTATGEKHCHEVHGSDVTICTWAIHAVANAIVYAANYGQSTLGSTLFVTDAPCILCAGMLLNAGVVRVVFDQEPTHGHHGLPRLMASGVLVEQLNFRGIPHS